MPKINPVDGGGTRIGDGLDASRAGHLHAGVDIFAPKGTPVYAADDGCAPANGGVKGDHGITGKSVTLIHNDGTSTNYFHLDKTCIQSGDCVKQGQQIGTVGTTGTTTSASHLHYEIHNSSQGLYGRNSALNPKDPSVGGLGNTSVDAACGGICGDSPSRTSYRPAAKSNFTTEQQPIQDPDATDAQQSCNKIDTPTTIKLQQRMLDPSDKKMISKRRIDKALESPHASQRVLEIAQQMAGNGGSSGGFTPPSSTFLTGRLGGSSNSDLLNEVARTASSINNLIHFTELDTGSLRQFITLIRGIPGVQGLASLPYFKPLSESIGSSITFLTDDTGLKNSDWITNAAQGLGVTTPISKLNRGKIFKPIVDSIDKTYQDINKSVELNLQHIYSQYAGFLSGFGSLLGMLPSQITGILGPLLSQAEGILGQLQGLAQGLSGGGNVLNQAAGFVSSIFDAYANLAKTPHGLDLVVDIAHHQRVRDVQSQMLNKITSKFGDQLRVLENHYPVRGLVVVDDGVIESDIHGYAAKVNQVGDKRIKDKYTNDVLGTIVQPPRQIGQPGVPTTGGGPDQPPLDPSTL